MNAEKKGSQALPQTNGGEKKHGAGTNIAAGNVQHFGITLEEVMSPMRPQQKSRVKAAIKDIFDRCAPDSRAQNGTRWESGGDNSTAMPLDELEKIIVIAIMQNNNGPIPSEKAQHG